MFSFFFSQRVRVAGLQSKLSWSLLSCYCGHCCCSCGCSSWLLLRRLLCYSSGLGCSSGCSFWLLCGRSFGCLCGALLCHSCCVNWGTFLPASGMLLRWLLLRLLFSRDYFRCCCYFSLLLMLFLVKVRRRAGLLSSRLPGNLTMLFLMP